MLRSFASAVSAVCGSICCFWLLACGGSSSTPTPPATADFSLAATPSTLFITPGATGQAISVTATPVNSFTGTVSVSLAGLPTGVTASPATLSLTPGAAQTITLSASASAVAGSATITLTGTSGTLSHAASVALTTTGPPDFSLTLAPTSLTITGGAAGGQVSVTATPLNSFSGSVAVALTGLPAGVTANPATLTLTPGTAQSTTLTAAVTVAAATPTVTFTGTSGSLSHTATLTLTVLAAPRTNAPDVTTFHYDNARDGLNAAETILTTANVNSSQFGNIGFDTVDGKVDAQPLFLANVIIGNRLENVLYIATEHGSVYAFDADSNTQLWKTSVIATGETTSDDHLCTQISPEIGITSTPVIDRMLGPNGTLFSVAMSKDSAGNYHQRLHALDLTTGAEIAGSPTEITGTYPSTGPNSVNGNVTFDPSQYAERAALLLLNGNIYLAWTSHCDTGTYMGWVMAYSESTLQQTQIVNLTPNGEQGSIWMSGDGLAADASGNVYLLDANGTFDMGFDGNGFPTKSDYGNALVKLSTTSTGTLAVADYFEPYNTDDESSNDEDLGSGGEMLLPDVKDATGATRHLIAGAGKDAHIYLGDRDNLGKFNSKSADNSNLYQDVTGALSGGIFSTPAYFNGVLYYGPVGGNLAAIPLTNAKLATSPSSQSPTIFNYPGATPTISASGTQNGVVWALESSPSNPGVLHAFDATDLSKELYNSNQAANGRDGFGLGNKYIAPMVVNGKVYVGTPSGVAIFGLLPAQ